MTQNSACQTACNSFHDRKSNGQLNYGVEKESHEMYCPVNAQQSGNTAAATLNILQVNGSNQILLTTWRLNRQKRQLRS